MDYSLQIGNDSTPWTEYQAIARVVDGGRWHTLYNCDHLVPPAVELMPHLAPDKKAYEDGDMFEGYTMLAAWAAMTTRVRLGCLVTAIPFRNPALLAKMAATIDHISNGRFELGLGAGWHTGETDDYGIELGSVKERLDRFHEALEVIRLLLTSEGRSSFDGRFYRLAEAPFAPRPVQNPLPLLIGGGGEKRTLKLVAQYATHYNFFGNAFSSPAIFAQKCRILDEHCAAIGRDPKEIRRSMALFADIQDDAQKARQTREFLGQPFGPEGQDALLITSADKIVEGTLKVLEEVQADEVIFCGVTQKAEAIKRFDDEVLSRLTA